MSHLVFQKLGEDKLRGVSVNHWPHNKYHANSRLSRTSKADKIIQVCNKQTALFRTASNMKCQATLCKTLHVSKNCFLALATIARSNFSATRAFRVAQSPLSRNPLMNAKTTSQIIFNTVVVVKRLQFTTLKCVWQDTVQPRLSRTSFVQTSRTPGIHYHFIHAQV